MASAPQMARMRAPLSDSIIVAVAKLVADATRDRREPSHSDIEFQVSRCGLGEADPVRQGQVVGKTKRVRAILHWAIENEPVHGEEFVYALVSTVRGCGGFRPDSPNFVGHDAIMSAVNAFKEEGYALALNGDLSPAVLENLDGAELTDALEAYVRRAKRGVEDPALLVGTGKDLLEATARHVIVETYGNPPSFSNFPGLLGQAFIALGLATPQSTIEQGEPPRRRLERALYEAGCAVNTLRNREGTGHGHSNLPSVTGEEARDALEIMGVVSGYLLRTLKISRAASVVSE